MPIRPNAQARGDVNSVKAGNASAKSCPAIIWKLRNGERPTADAQRPQRPALTVLRSLRVQPAPIETHVIVEALGFGVEGVMKKRGAGGGHARSRSGSSPSSPSSTARINARALSSVQ